MINVLLTCRDRSARFNNNRDIAMIRTGKTRSADVDILSAYKSTADTNIHQLFSPYMAGLVHTTRVYNWVYQALYRWHVEMLGVYLVRLPWDDHSVLSVSGFHSCRLGPRSTRSHLPITNFARVFCSMIFVIFFAVEFFCQFEILIYLLLWLVF